MHPMFQVTLYTGQQLVLEAMQRWLRRPCTEVEQQRQRNAKLKDLLLLLVKTAATGVLATILDAAIEYRRRQLLAAAVADPSEQDGVGARFPGLGALSRAGVAAWKHRLLVCIDEVERRAEAYGIEPTGRFGPGPGQQQHLLLEGPPEGKGKAPAAAATSRALSRVASAAELTDDERQQMLTRTVAQLRELVKQGDDEADKRLDTEVGGLIDVLLGPLASPAAPTTSALGLRPRSSASSSSSSLLLGDGGSGGDDDSSEGESSAAAVAACNAGLDRPACACAGCEGGKTHQHTCQICMDAPIKVSLLDCKHGMCFTCARRLCSGQDHLMPSCPFCRQAIQGFAAYSPPAHEAT